MGTLKEYILEIIILFLGLVVSVIELVLVTDKNLGILIIVISLFVAMSTFSIRREIQMRGEPILSLLTKIPAEWREEAQSEIEELHKKLRRWTDGTREVQKSEIINYEIGMLLKATKHVRALYIGVPLEVLFLWSPNRTGSFRRYAESYRKLSEKIKKRRIFLCRKSNLLRDDTISSDEVKEIFQEQITPVSDGGIGAEVRLLWWEIVQRDNLDIPGSFLIVDEKEVFRVRGNERLPYLEAKAIANPKVVRNYMKLYERLWNIADPVEKWLKIEKKKGYEKYETKGG